MVSFLYKRKGERGYPIASLKWTKDRLLSLDRKKKASLSFKKGKRMASSLQTGKEQVFCLQWRRASSISRKQTKILPFRKEKRGHAVSSLQWKMGGLLCLEGDEAARFLLSPKEGLPPLLRKERRLLRFRKGGTWFPFFIKERGREDTQSPL